MHIDGHTLNDCKENLKLVYVYDQEIPQSQNADQPIAPWHTTVTRHQEDKLSKVTSSLFPSR